MGTDDASVPEGLRQARRTRTVVATRQVAAARVRYHPIPGPQLNVPQPGPGQLVQDPKNDDHGPFPGGRWIPGGGKSLELAIGKSTANRVAAATATADAIAGQTVEDRLNLHPGRRSNAAAIAPIAALEITAKYSVSASKPVALREPSE